MSMSLLLNQLSHFVFLSSAARLVGNCINSQRAEESPETAGRSVDAALLFSPVYMFHLKPEII